MQGLFLYSSPICCIMEDMLNSLNNFDSSLFQISFCSPSSFAKAFSSAKASSNRTADTYQGEDRNYSLNPV